MAARKRVSSNPRLITIESAMSQLSLGRNSVYNLINSGQLKSVKVGRRRYTTPHFLDEFIANLEASA